MQRIERRTNQWRSYALVIIFSESHILIHFDLLLALTCLQRFNHIILIGLHITDLDSGLIFIAPIVVGLKPNNLQLILKVLVVQR